MRDIALSHFFPIETICNIVLFIEALIFQWYLLAEVEGLLVMGGETWWVVSSEFHGSMASSVTAHRNSVVANCTPEGKGGKGKRANYWEGQGAGGAAHPGDALSRS